jgi:hypothetical protein
MYLRGRKGRKHGENCIIRRFINLYVSPIISRVIKSRSIRWAWHVARIGEMRNAYRTRVVKKLKSKEDSENLDVYGMTTLEWILGKQGGKL